MLVLKEIPWCLLNSRKGGIVKKYTSHITVALVCALLGFLLTYQFKLLNAQDKKLKSNNYNQEEIVNEVEQLKKEKEEIEKKNNEVTAQLKQYEDAATNNNDLTKELKKQLDDTRLILGSMDVKGPGITLYLTPKNPVFSNNTNTSFITDDEIVYIINELNFSGAEAVSVNDKRITVQTGIKSSSNNSFILINDEKISPKDRIVIKAIGNKSTLENGVNFPGVFHYQNLENYNIDIKTSDEIKIPKFNKSYKYEYMKPVK